MAMFDPFQDGGELTWDSLVEAKAKHLGELVGGKAEQPEVAGALEEFMDGEVSSEDEVATVFDLLQGSSGNLCVNGRPLGERMKTPTVLHGLRNIY